MNQTNLPRRRELGVTMIELLIVVAIITMISAFAYPSYMDHVVSAKRTAAASALLQVADRQQQFFMDNKRFAGSLTNLGFGANPLIIADDGRAVAAGDADSVYSISLSNVAATTFTVTAAPLSGQLSRDTECGSLSLTQAGAKSSSGGGSDCW